jgi:hypothetical protein
MLSDAAGPPTEAPSRALRISTRHRSPAGNRNLTIPGRVARIILPFRATQAQGGTGGSQRRKASPTRALVAEPRTEVQAQGTGVAAIATSRLYTMHGGYRAVLDPGASAAGHCTLREAAAEGVAGVEKRAAWALPGCPSYGAGMEWVWSTGFGAGTLPLYAELLGSGCVKSDSLDGAEAAERPGGWSLTCMLRDVALRVPVATSKSPAVVGAICRFRVGRGGHYNATNTNIAWLMGRAGPQRALDGDSGYPPAVRVSWLTVHNGMPGVCPAGRVTCGRAGCPAGVYTPRA